MVFVFNLTPPPPYFVILAPSAPTQLKVVAVSSSQLGVSWQPPLEPNGVITGYDITWMMTKNDLGESVTGETNGTSLAPSARMYFVKYLGEHFVFFCK